MGQFIGLVIHSVPMSFSITMIIITMINRFNLLNLYRIASRSSAVSYINRRRYAHSPLIVLHLGVNLKISSYTLFFSRVCQMCWRIQSHEDHCHSEIGSYQ
jgi:hypothetical protein